MCIGSSKLWEVQNLEWIQESPNRSWAIEQSIQEAPQTFKFCQAGHFSLSNRDLHQILLFNLGFVNTGYIPIRVYMWLSVSVQQVASPANSKFGKTTSHTVRNKLFISWKVSPVPVRFGVALPRMFKCGNELRLIQLRTSEHHIQGNSVICHCASVKLQFLPFPDIVGVSPEDVSAAGRHQGVSHLRKGSHPLAGVRG